MALEVYRNQGGKKLRCGYTTGTCAALAAQAAARALLLGETPAQASLVTPKGIPVQAPVLDLCRQPGGAYCAVEKDAGDDFDVTHGMKVGVWLYTAPEGIWVDGGEGVGRVTKPGLDQPVGAAAINRVPRQMITQAVDRERKALGSTDGFLVTISVSGGEEAAQRTFNPHLGIEGGISILGTSGIVEPMSVQALVDTMALELRQAALGGDGRLVLVPGNYGLDFLAQHALISDGIPVVRCSNFIGEALDQARLEGFREVLLVGHIGKLVKLAGGIMNTHSRWADGRRELFCAHAALAGADRQTAQALMDCATTDGCLEVLDEAGLQKAVLTSLLEAIQGHLDRRFGPEGTVGAVLFSNQYGLLGLTPKGKELTDRWNNAM